MPAIARVNRFRESRGIFHDRPAHPAETQTPCTDRAPPVGTRHPAPARGSGYDLPDLTNTYKALPASAHLLKEQMEATLLKYEPRIRSIDVEIPENDDSDVLVSFEMTCRLKKIGLARFGTYFEPPGRMRVKRRIPERS
ncbi:GPW/gp25 family protein (plasmid) [Burkholderia thailandensis]|nr:GPW/gp25 family protein [Burkholderia thailandensis]QRA15407.1 GPW/gp25 family protein [Burkholderia thailandensis]